VGQVLSEVRVLSKNNSYFLNKLSVHPSNAPEKIKFGDLIASEEPWAFSMKINKFRTVNFFIFAYVQSVVLRDHINKDKFHSVILTATPAVDAHIFPYVRTMSMKNIIVAVDRLQTIDLDQVHATYLRCRDSVLRAYEWQDIKITCLPIQSNVGWNVVSRVPDASYASWYDGPTLLEAIARQKVTPVNVMCPARFMVARVADSRSVVGYLRAGVLTLGDVIQTAAGTSVEIISISLNNVQKSRVTPDPRQITLKLSVKTSNDQVVSGLFKELDLIGPGVRHVTEHSRVAARIVLVDPPGLKYGQPHTLCFTHGNIVCKVDLVQELDTVMSHSLVPNTTSMEPKMVIVELTPLGIGQFCLECEASYPELSKFWINENQSILGFGAITKIKY
jgi:translation elongation factor EF-1alpha